MADIVRLLRKAKPYSAESVGGLQVRRGGRDQAELPLAAPAVIPTLVVIPNEVSNCLEPRSCSGCDHRIAHPGVEDHQHLAHDRHDRHFRGLALRPQPVVKRP